MAILTEKQLEEAREYIRNWELEAFDFWMEENKILIDRRLVIETFKKVQISNDIEKAIRMFDVTFVGMDPQAERIGLIFERIIKAKGTVLLIGCILAGLVFLVKVILGV